LAEEVKWLKSELAALKTKNAILEEQFTNFVLEEQVPLTLEERVPLTLKKGCHYLIFSIMNRNKLAISGNKLKN